MKKIYLNKKQRKEQKLMNFLLKLPQGTTAREVARKGVTKILFSNLGHKPVKDSHPVGFSPQGFYPAG